MLRIGRELHRSLTDFAQKRETSINRVCEEFIDQGLKGDSSSHSQKVPQLLDSNQIPVEGVVLFGSEARKESRLTSDIDLLIVLAENYSISRSLYKIWDGKITPYVDSRYSPHFVNLPKSVDDVGGIWFEVALDGVPLWDPKGSVQNVLRLLRKDMAEGNLIREISHGHPYWIRK